MTTKILKKASRATHASQFVLDLPNPGALLPLDAPTIDGRTGDSPEYCFDPADGLPAEEVKPHCRDKHALLAKYVDICSAVRNKYQQWGGLNCYIDLYCGPGRVRFSDTRQFADGSPLVAWEAAAKSKRMASSRFSYCIIGDAEEKLFDGACTRLRTRGADVYGLPGEAIRTACQAVRMLPRKGFHFAFLDPYSIGGLPFSVIQELASVKTLDILLHFSVMDLRRNLARFMSGELPYLDTFAPGWKDVVDARASNEANFRAVEMHWKKLVEHLGKPARGVELVRGSRGAHLYWLVLLSGSDLAQRFFTGVSVIGRQRALWGSSA